MIKYPILATTHAAKAAFVERCVKLLMLEHNIMGAWWDTTRPMITLTQYQTLRAQVQTRWPWTGEKLNKVEWGKYQEERFDIKLEILNIERGLLKAAMYESTRFDPNLDDDIVADLT